MEDFLTALNPETLLLAGGGVAWLLAFIHVFSTQDSRRREQQERIEGFRSRLGNLENSVSDFVSEEELARQALGVDVPAQDIPPPAMSREAAKTPPPASPPQEKRSLLSDRLEKTRSGFLGKLKNIFSTRATLDIASVEELEEALITSDLGVQLTSKILEDVQGKLAAQKEGMTLEKIRDEVRNHVRDIFDDEAATRPIHPGKRNNELQVVLVVGVNGAGKTTSTAKLGFDCKQKGASVILAAADTFRAAAVEQLKEWGRRLSIPVISGAENAKPGTVVFEALKVAKEQDADIVLIDTAGRLHTKTNLMQELEGVYSVIRRHVPSAPHETLLVVDGSSGQNALQQAREFHAAVPLTGIIVTKLDGTPKGGVVAAIKSELGIPVRYIGVGEKAEDLRVFDAEEFVDAVVGS